MVQKVSVWKAEEERTLSWKQGMGKEKIKQWTATEQYRKIGEGAFKNNTKLKSVVLPEHVKEIGIQSFYNTALREIQIDGIVRIGKEAFGNCSRLQQMKLPETIQYMGKRAFVQCRKLEFIEFAPNALCSEIRTETFLECNSLKEILLPEKLQKIGNRAFYKCLALEDISFPAGLTEIGMEAFYQTGLKDLKFSPNLVKIGEKAFFKCNQLEHVIIPEHVKVIEKWVFHGCNRLKLLEISGEPEQIGPWIINRSARIRCKKGGTVDRYCQESGFEVEYI